MDERYEPKYDENGRPIKKNKLNVNKENNNIIFVIILVIILVLLPLLFIEDNSILYRELGGFVPILFFVLIIFLKIKFFNFSNSKDSTFSDLHKKFNSQNQMKDQEVDKFVKDNEEYVDEEEIEDIEKEDEKKYFD